MILAKYSRVERRKASIKMKIINASLEVFTEFGYVKTTVDDITTRADIGHGTFYKYFKNKQDLLSFLADDLIEIMVEYHPKHKELSVYERIKDRIQVVMDFYVNHRNILLVLNEAMIVDRQFEEKWIKIHETLNKYAERNLKASADKGYCRNVDMDMAIIALFSMVEGYAHYTLKQPPGAMDINAIVDTMADLCYHALFKVTDEVNCP
ncbi:MAG: TetR/AcrR family transcriptional regulator [Firmicutes bacterium]|nr:TetR/AcrR family transcriptional regulator [Bacillota bacterium]